MTQSKNSKFSINPQALSEEFHCKTDERGTLCVAQHTSLKHPFEIKRVFWIYHVPQGAIRGEHANRNCTELLVAVNGKVKVSLSDGHTTCEVVLNRPDMGLYIPPMVWCQLKEFSEDCVCICMADQDYEEKYYINQYEDFIKETSNASQSL